MKKILILCLLALMVFGVASVSFAATEGRTATNVRRARDLSSAVAITDGASGYTADVDSDGDLSIVPGAKSVVSSIGGADTQLITGACTVYSITVTAPTAGDYALFYDNTSATGDPIFDIKIGTNNSTEHLALPAGATFNNGVYLDRNDTGVSVTVVYDQ